MALVANEKWYDQLYLRNEIKDSPKLPQTKMLTFKLSI